MSTFLDWLKTIVVVALIFVVIHHFISFSVIDGKSMEATYDDHDYAVMFHSRNYERGDVIGFEFIDPEQGVDEYHIKRIIGVPGDDVVVDGYQVYVNDELIVEDGMQYYKYTEYQLSDDEYFVLGDNYEVSYDSRKHGAIKKDDIIGKVILHIGKDTDGSYYFKTKSPRIALTD